MSESDQRPPAAFRLDPPSAPEAERPPRQPRAFEPEESVVVPAERDAFEEPNVATAPPVPLRPPRRRSILFSVFAAAFGILVSLALGLWADRLVRELFTRAEWLGWFGAGAAVLAALALGALLVRELSAMRRLASVEALRQRARGATARDDGWEARALVRELTALLAAKPEIAAGRRALAELEGDVVDGAALLRLAEVELLTPLDVRAKAMVLDAAKRVALVTAVSPRALFDVGYVLFESGRLVRRMAELYGGRPGTLGFFRLARSALAHLAVTGSIAAGDSLVQQIVGHGLAARLSAKLGEGVVNGMMTARIGVAAMEAARPLPFTALERPGMGDFLAALARFSSSRDEPS